jgi:hypothetical protein
MDKTHKPGATSRRGAQESPHHQREIILAQIGRWRMAVAVDRQLSRAVEETFFQQAPALYYRLPKTQEVKTQSRIGRNDGALAPTKSEARAESIFKFGSRRPQKDDCEMRQRKVLMKGQALVCSEEFIETMKFGAAQEFAVADSSPTSPWTVLTSCPANSLAKRRGNSSKL